MMIDERYQIEHELGAGGMGSVYRAVDHKLGRAVAIKLMGSRFVERADAHARFEREARVGAQLNHPHIIATYDYGVADGVGYLVLQLLAGGDLRHWQADQPARRATVLDACAIVYQVADGLSAAHAAGVVHRDLKPENILFEAREPLHVRIADFGMAFLRDGEGNDGRITRDGQFAGTPAYLAPEQVINEGIGPPADIYALGVVLFELLAGRPPFEATGASLLAQHVYAAPPKLTEFRDDVPGAISELVDRMLAKPPHYRPTAEVVRRRLVHWIGDYASREARARDATAASDRDDRMISTTGSTTPTSPPWGGPTDDRRPVVIVHGALASDQLTALHAAGFTVASSASEPAVAAIAIGQPDDVVAQLVASGRPIVASCPRGEFTRVASLLRLGVAEVVVEPVMPDALVRKLERAVASSRHRRD